MRCRRRITKHVCSRKVQRAHNHRWELDPGWIADVNWPLVIRAGPAQDAFGKHSFRRPAIGSCWAHLAERKPSKVSGCNSTMTCRSSSKLIGVGRASPCRYLSKDELKGVRQNFFDASRSQGQTGILRTGRTSGLKLVFNTRSVCVSFQPVGQHTDQVEFLGRRVCGA